MQDLQLEGFGGKWRVYDKPGKAAVAGPGLAMSRAFGDDLARFIGVTAEPEVTSHSLTTADEFFIVATDGIFDYISSQEAVDIVSACDGDLKRSCRQLARRAASLWKAVPDNEHYRDDITLIIVKLGRGAVRRRAAHGSAEVDSETRLRMAFPGCDADALSRALQHAHGDVNAAAHVLLSAAPDDSGLSARSMPARRSSGSRDGSERRPHRQRAAAEAAKTAESSDALVHASLPISAMVSVSASVSFSIPASVSLSLVLAPPRAAVSVPVSASYRCHLSTGRDNG